MKYLKLILVVLLFTSCKNDKREDNNLEIDDTEQAVPLAIDTLQIGEGGINSLNRAVSIEFKQKALIEKKDQRSEFQKLIIDKSYSIKQPDYTINFKYPQLDESYKATNRNFNEFIKDYYVNIKQTVSDIEASKMLCDSIEALNFREDRFIDYKIYIVNDQLVSVLFYKEDFYSGAMHPSYSFDCFNFDLNQGVFMNYEDFFNQGSEDELLTLINERIVKKIQNEELYYDCWELSPTDFFESKNNFVINDNQVEFYFDDCVMCPSYTGSYSIELPLVELLSVLKKSNANLLTFDKNQPSR
ncbi:RsiV family protein [Gelidibacter sp.]|uniref:RsiV family protein n=1 Tax=Gelidibacter sp. TaxID=2018083 RepID=UPI002C1BC292|nr:RsiV family protein [Gelidibacter sp.]HUH29031.1 RsiV family protein [Gelidibacter sp.]